MTDIVTPEKRSQMMAGIRGANTKPEIAIRKALHARGFRYRLHVKGLPGKPDLVFPKHRAVLFIHGCFWHGHDCPLFKLPSTRQEFWSGKISGNKQNDDRVVQKLRHSGWRIGIIWECSIRGRKKRSFDEVISACSTWLYSDDPMIEIRSFT